MLERLNRAERRQDALERSVKDLRREFSQVKQWGGRAALLVMLWGSAIGVNVNAQELGEALAALVKLALQLR